MSATIAVIGLGGIGSWLIEPLIRYAKAKMSIEEVILIDGDHYSVGNQTRQCIHPKLTGMNKASATALKMRQYFPEVKFREVPEFITNKNINDIFICLDDLFIFNCCDNNYCRKILSQWVSMQRRGDITLISGGNEVTDGNAHMQQRYCGQNMGRTLIESHPEIALAPEDENRGEMSCQQLANLPSSNQVIITNFWAAAIMLQQLYLLYEDRKVQETFFDINTSAINAIR